MKTKKIVWKAEQRFLPKFGEVQKGDIKILPENIAESYISQGLAVPFKSTKQEKT